MSEIDEKKVALREELDRLNHEFKIELPKKIAEARAYGDLKENAEYHAARERQSFVKARIGQLNEQLAQLNELNIADVPHDSVGFGATVTLVDEDDDDEKVEFTIVSPNEVDPSAGKISFSSPIGAALQGKKPGESLEFSTPAGERHYYLEKLVTVHGDEIVVPYEAE